jgi:hypothetical protein
MEEVEFEAMVNDFGLASRPTDQGLEPVVSLMTKSVAQDVLRFDPLAAGSLDRNQRRSSLAAFRATARNVAPSPLTGGW